MSNASINYENRKDNFTKKIPQKIGSIMDITPEVRELLGNLYHEEEIFIKTAEIL
jgi:hypothetical protein